MNEEVIWQSTIAASMVADLDQDSIDMLVDDLNNAVLNICQVHGVGE